MGSGEPRNGERNGKEVKRVKKEDSKEVERGTLKWVKVEGKVTR